MKENVVDHDRYRARRRPVARNVPTIAILLVVSMTLFPLAPGARGAGKGEKGEIFPAEVLLQDRPADLKLLTDLEIDVDAVFRDRARCYLLEEEMEKLVALGFLVERIPDEAREEGLREKAAREAAEGAPLPGGAAPGAALSIPASYHTYATLTSELQAIAAARPDLVRLYSLGQSVQGRELWMMEISDNPGTPEDEPEIRYIAAMHGDEVVGKELTIGLIHYLLDNYGTDPRVTHLVDEAEIWLMPSMNPDGTELVQRYNAAGYDLNRNFPDQFTDPTDTVTGRQPEVQAVMNWGYAHNGNVSANFHGGSLVANYPYDGTTSGSNTYSACPDDVPMVSLARSYADHNPSMFASNSDDSFFNGICNGADWYVVRGGMQDWNYVYRGDWHITLELGTKWPAASTLPTYWTENIESMLSYFERAFDGVRGVVTDAVTGAPLRATIKVVGNAQLTFSDPAVGDYHRLILPGAYTLEVSAPGHVTSLETEVVVPAGGGAVRRDVALAPLAVELQPTSYRVLDGASGNGTLDPGETTDFSVILRNLGLSATGVTGTLQPIGWYASVPRASAAYPNIAVGASAQCLSPYYSVSLSPGAPPGNKVGFVVRWSASSRSGTTDPFFVPAGARTCTTVVSTGPPQSIPDRASRSSSLAFAPTLEIDEVNAYVDVTHPYKGDLAITLRSPSGTPVVLHDRTGGSADNVIGWFDAQITPAEPLARFVGEDAAGTWTLTATDAVPANTGTLNTWSLEVCGRPFEARPPEMMLKSVTKGAGHVRLEWWPYPGLTSYRVYRAESAQSAAGFADVTASDPDPADTQFEDASPAPLLYYLITGVGPRGEGPWGAYGQ
jgi:subtilisin-like proprotein convertase family protein